MRDSIVYENSPFLPVTVISAVKDFDVTVTGNAYLLIKILNEALHKSPDYFLHYDEDGSPYWHAIDPMYFGRFTDLRPKADKIRDAIREFLNTQ